MKKKSVIFVAITTLIVAVVYTIGTSFAYYAISISTNATAATATTATIAGFEFEGITSDGFSDVMHPGWVGYQRFSAKGVGSGAGGFYKLDMTVSGTSALYSQISYQIYKGTGVGSCAISSINNSTTPTVSGNTVTFQGSITIPVTCVSQGSASTVTVGTNQILSGTYVASTNEEYLIVYRYDSTASVQNGGQLGTFSPQVSANYVST